MTARTARTRRGPGPTRGRVTALAVALAVLALVAGCGDSDQSADQVFNETFSGQPDIRGGTLSASLTAVPQGGQAMTVGAQGQAVPVRLIVPFKGPFETVGPGRLPRFDLVGQLPAAPGAPTPRDRIAIAADGSKAFLSVEGVTYEVPPGGFEALQRAYAQFSSARGEPNALAWLTDQKVEGEQELAGTDTIHVSADVDLAKLLDDVGGSLDASVRRQIERTISGVRLDVWSVEDGNALRRMRVAFDVAQQGRPIAGVTGGRVAITVDVSDVNDGQKVETPTSGEPFARLTRKLEAISDQAARVPQTMPGQPAGAPRTPDSTAPPPAGPAPLPPGADPKKQRKYVECLSRAEDDLLAVQACGRVLLE